MDISPFSFNLPKDKRASQTIIKFIDPLRHRPPMSQTMREATPVSHLRFNGGPRSGASAARP